MRKSRSRGHRSNRSQILSSIMLIEAKKRKDLHLMMMMMMMVELQAEGTRKEVCENLLVQEVIL